MMLVRNCCYDWFAMIEKLGHRLPVDFVAAPSELRHPSVVWCGSASYGRMWTLQQLDLTHSLGAQLALRDIR